MVGSVGQQKNNFYEHVRSNIAASKHGTIAVQRLSSGRSGIVVANARKMDLACARTTME